MKLSRAAGLLGNTASPLGTGVAAITPADTDFANSVWYRRLYVTGAGDVAIVAVDESTAVFTMAAKTYLDVAVKQVKATGTTATGIIGIK